jgi:Transposase zinc-ribbon domain
MWYAGAVEALFEATATGRAMAKGRSLSQFQETFPDEASCAAFLSERRWPEGFVCPGCDYRKPEAMPRGLDDAKQQAFIENTRTCSNTMGSDEAVAFVDAVHPTPSGQAGRLLGSQGRRDRGRADDRP